MERRQLEAGLRALAAAERLQGPIAHNRQPQKTPMKALRHRRVRRKMRQRLTRAVG